MKFTQHIVSCLLVTSIFGLPVNQAHAADVDPQYGPGGPGDLNLPLPTLSDYTFKQFGGFGDHYTEVEWEGSDGTQGTFTVIVNEFRGTTYFQHKIGSDVIMWSYKSHGDDDPETWTTSNRNHLFKFERYANIIKDLPEIQEFKDIESRGKSCGDFCMIGGGIAGVALGWLAAGTCGGASLGVAAPGCILAGHLIGEASGGIAGLACKSAFC